MTYEELREEWEHSYILREMVRNVCGNTCCNCGSTENIQYHHIVPLKLGGTNKTSNIVAICHRCHCAAHRGRHISHYQNKAITGRPSMEVEEELFDAYVNGLIGANELRELADIHTGSHIADLAAFKKYKKRKGIVKSRNYIDVKLKNRGSIEDGEEIGFITYKDGTTKTIKYKKLMEYCKH